MTDLLTRIYVQWLLATLMIFMPCAVACAPELPADLSDL